MTREEAIEELRRDIALENDFTDDYINAVDMAIKALEQDSVIDKIRDEIIQSIQNGTIKIESGTEMLFRIIDLYKTESEE